MATYFEGAVKSGSSPSEYTNVGYAVFTQTTTVTTIAAGTATSATITIPADCQIIDYYVDGTVAAVAGGGTAAAVAVTVGTAAAGEQYMTSTDGILGGRIAPAKTVAQVLAMEDVNANTSVVITVDPDGTVSTTQGVFRLTVVYAPKL